MDITERRKAEEALRQSEEKYRLHFESISDVIYSIDSGFRVLRVSPSVERVLGYKPEELVGRPFQELNILTPESLERAFSDSMHVFSGERVVSTEYEFIAKDGTRKFGEVSGAPLYSQEGKVVATISVARDITERKRAEEEVRRYTKQLEALFNIGATVSQTLNLEELLGSVLDTLLIVMGVEVGGIFLLDKQTSKLLLRAHRGMSPKFARQVQVVSVGDGFIGQVAKSGKPMMVEDEGLLFVHSEASHPQRWHYVRSTTDAAKSLIATSAHVTFCGHIHRPALYSMSVTAKMTSFVPKTDVPVQLLRGRQWLAVLGSVGQPRDGDPSAAFALFDTVSCQITYCRAPYDVAAAAGRIRDNGLPSWLADRLSQGR